MSKSFTTGNYFNRDAASNAIANAPGAASALSWSAWLHIDAFNGSDQQPISIGENSFDFLFGLVSQAGGALKFYLEKGSTGQLIQITSQTITVATWTHLAATWDGTNLRAYINGVQVATTTGTITAQPAINYVEIAFINGGGETHQMQDVTMYGAALSAPEIAQLYRNRQPGRRANLYVNWPMLPSAAGNTLDYSGGANNGIQNGTVTAGTSEPQANWGPRSNRVTYFTQDTGSLNFSGVAVSPSAATGTLRNKVAFAGTATSPSAAVGTLRDRILFTSGVAVSPTSAVGTLRGRIPFTSAVSTSPSSAVAGLLKKAVFSSNTCVSPSAAVGVLAVKKLFAGVAVSPTAAVGVVQARQKFTSGVAVSPTAATATFGARMVFTPTCSSKSAATGGLTVLSSVSFSGVAVSPTAATGSLRATRQFSGVAVSPSAATATFRKVANMSAVSVSPTAAVGGLRVRVPFTPACVTRSSAVGILTGGTVINPTAAEDEKNSQKRRSFAVGHFHRGMRR